VKYSDQIVQWLKCEGYTHCFFVAGGNIMHLLNSVRSEMACLPFVHEVGAAIAVEAFNETSNSKDKRAFLLVTAGPGLTNAITGITGAWLESRELLVIGGQVKSSDLKNKGMRQRGIQEIDGVELVSSITKDAIRITKPIPRKAFISTVRKGSSERKGPIFIEICLDAQANPAIEETDASEAAYPKIDIIPILDDKTLKLIKQSKRPVILIGGGVEFDFSQAHKEDFINLGIPLMTTWNGADRISSDQSLYFGRPNTWGQRAANILIQQSDLVLAVGTRLGLQQTGFAWEDFVPNGKVIQIDIDKSELDKGHPRIEHGINVDSVQFLTALFSNTKDLGLDFSSWVEFCNNVKELLPLNDPNNLTKPEFIDPYLFGMALSGAADSNAVLVPCSSGSSFTVLMQTLCQTRSQRIISSKGLASMGYGLSTAIGSAFANPEKQVVLVEGDGGFAQNLQELGTIAANNLPIKIFIWANNGYASIRMTQRNYFDGAWVGCDSETGLGLPDLEQLAKTYRIPYLKVTNKLFEDKEMRAILKDSGPAIIEVPIDPEQTFYPKITSSVQPDGSMKSNPLHLMSPDLPDHLSEKVFKYI
jgi:acetolactate synthase-1/2/3 large subunit